MKVYRARGARRRARGRSCSKEWHDRDAPGHAADDPGRARRLHRLRRLRRRLPGRSQGGGQAQGDRHGAEARAPRRERANFDFFLDIPETRPDARRPATVKGSQCCEPLFEFSGACAGCGETPVPQAADPALRRPDARRQRDRLLVDLRRQPADDAVVDATRDGRGPAWSNSLFEDNAEFGLGMRLGARRAGAHARTLLDGSPRRSARTSRRRASSTRASDDEAGIAAQRERVAELKARCSSGRRRPDGAREPRGRRRRRSSARASGSSAATAGPTTSASAGSTTCWPRPRRQRAGARHRGLLEHRRPGLEGHAARRGGEVRRRRQADAARRTSGMIAMRLRQRVRRRRSRSAPTTPQTVKAFAEAEAWPGPSLIIAYSHVHRARHRHGDVDGAPEGRRATAATGRCTASTPARRDGEHPFQLDSAAPTIPLAEFAKKEARFAMLARSRPGRRRAAAAARAGGRRRALAPVRAARGRIERATFPGCGASRATDREARSDRMSRPAHDLPRPASSRNPLVAVGVPAAGAIDDAEARSRTPAPPRSCCRRCSRSRSRTRRSHAPPGCSRPAPRASPRR